MQRVKTLVAGATATASLALPLPSLLAYPLAYAIYSYSRHRLDRAFPWPRYPLSTDLPFLLASI
ncbi:MAG: hypothetical protein SGCHY_000839, partial [Lobulomycetales sp.]